MFSLKHTFYITLLFIFISYSTVFSQDFWQQTSGPKDGGGDYEFLYTIAIDNSGNIFAGSAGNGLYRSTNQGNSWQHVIDDFIIVWKIAINSNGVIFACTDQEGIFRSTDSGDTWEKIFQDGTWITSISIDENDVIYICTESEGLYMSDDDGENWNQIWDPGFIFWQIFVDNNGNIFTSTFGDGIFRSSDGGNNWDNLGFDSDIIWQFAQGPDGRLWMGTDMDGLYESDDEGDNWTPNGLNGMPISTVLFDSKGTILVSDYDMSIYRSLDEGATWDDISSGLSWGINGTAIDAQSRVYIASFGGGVFKSLESSFPAVFTNVQSLGDEFCQGEAVEVSFTIDGLFHEENTFTLEISDVNGDFDNAFVLGTMPGQSSATFSSIYIPTNLPAGTGYRFRVLSDTHPTESNDNGEDITINNVVVTLLEPADEETGVELTPELSWDAPLSCSNTYSIEISTNENFTNIIVAIVNHTGESITLANPLSMLTDYWWRVGSETESGDVVYTNPSKFTTMGQTVFTQQINLAFGWNMMSTYINPEELDMEVILQDIINSVVIVKNNIGQVYFPLFEINDIGNWNIFEGYQIYMSQAETLVITGTKIAPEDTPIPITAGWNMVSYIRDNQMDIETALASITDNNNLIIAKDNLGNVYFPEFEINGIGNMIPGQAYQIYVLSNDNLQYPAN